MLRKAGLDTEQALVMITMHKPYARIRSLVRAHLSRYSAHHFAKIDELFVCIGISDLCQHAEAKTKQKDLLRSVRALVRRRNEIAHSGDMNSHGKLQAVNPNQLVHGMRAMMLFVESADSIIENVVAKPAPG